MAFVEKYILTYCLRPFSWVYGCITAIRNFLFDKGYKKSTKFDFPVISVGNITVGGTGKTPHVEYLIRLLATSYRVATLSRGYGRKTKGFILADATTNADAIGDEPQQFYQKFAPHIAVAVGEKRVEAMQRLQALYPVEIGILDDAFQHRAITPSLSIVLVDYNRPIDEDFPFPAGRLRENRSGLQRADVIIVSKCPADLDEKQQAIWEKRLRKYHPKPCPIFFTTIRYAPITPYAVENTLALTEACVLVTGIAKADVLENYLQTQVASVQHLRFADHHVYTATDIHKICAMAQDKSILTTEKDMVKLKPLLQAMNISTKAFYYVPIEIAFLFDQAPVFNGLVVQHIEHFKK